MYILLKIYTCVLCVCVCVCVNINDVFSISYSIFKNVLVYKKSMLLYISLVYWKIAIIAYSEFLVVLVYFLPY